MISVALAVPGLQEQSTALLHCTLLLCPVTLLCALVLNYFVRYDYKAHSRSHSLGRLCFDANIVGRRVL